MNVLFFNLVDYKSRIDGVMLPVDMTYIPFAAWRCESVEFSQ
jgi:hypothetical protein